MFKSYIYIKLVSWMTLCFFSYLFVLQKHTQQKNLRQICIWNTLQYQVNSGTAKRTELMKWWYVFYYTIVS